MQAGRNFSPEREKQNNGGNLGGTVGEKAIGIHPSLSEKIKHSTGVA